MQNRTLIFFAAVFSVSYFFTHVSAQKAVEYLAKQISDRSQMLPESPKSSFRKSVDNVSGATVIQKYIAAIGGAQQLQNVQSINFKGSIKTAGMQLRFSERKQAPNLDYIAVSVDGDTMMRSVFDGQSGYNQQISEKTPLTEQEIKARNTDYIGLFNQLYYLDSSKSFTLNNIRHIKDEDDSTDVFELEIKLPSGKIVTESYDTRTSLLTRSVEEEVGQSVTVTSKTFSDYQSVNGILFPCKINMTKAQNEKEQQFDIAVNTTEINLPAE
ncbi:MAG: hypothetical protein QM610_12155 [Chitinophagaceae bacterium]